MDQVEARRPADVVLPLLAVIGAMASFQAGAAIAKGLFPAVGPQGAASLRLCIGAVVLIAIVRPWRRWPRPAPVLSLVGLGLAMAAAILFFYAAIQHLPLAIAIALQFLGPLCIAIFGSRRPIDLLWAALAALGVWFLVSVGRTGTHLDLRGVPWALAAAAGWAAYILVGRSASAAFGSSTAPLAVTIAALAILPVGVQHAGTALLSPALLPRALVVGLLSTAIPFSLEFYALPRMPARTFAIFTSLEPAFGVLSGFVLLSERLSLAQVGGIACVIAAAAGAAWSSARRRAPALADAPVT
jgi:inner membrane transporter RhtA